MSDGINGSWEIKDTAAGKGMCHRAQFLIIPQTLGKFIVSRPPCTGASCALWDLDNGRCRDVSNSIYLEILAHTLHTIVDHLPPTLP